jgi:hypothetical protein
MFDRAGNSLIFWFKIANKGTLFGGSIISPGNQARHFRYRSLCKGSELLAIPKDVRVAKKKEVRIIADDRPLTTY